MTYGCCIVVHKLRHKQLIPTSLRHVPCFQQEVIKKTVTFESAEEGGEEDVTRELRELQTEHAALVMELDKVNMLLEIQYKLKQDYQDEVRRRG